MEGLDHLLSRHRRPDGGVLCCLRDSGRARWPSWLDRAHYDQYRPGLDRAPGYSAAPLRWFGRHRPLRQR